MNQQSNTVSTLPQQQSKGSKAQHPGSQKSSTPGAGAAPVVPVSPAPALPVSLSLVLPVDAPERKTMRGSIARALRFPRVNRKGKWIRNTAKSVYFYTVALAGSAADAPASLLLGRGRVDADKADAGAPESMRGDGITGADALAGFTLSPASIAGAYGCSPECYRAIAHDLLSALGLRVLAESGDADAGADPDKALARATRGVVGVLDTIQVGALGIGALPSLVDLCNTYRAKLPGGKLPEQVALKLGIADKRVKSGESRKMLDAVKAALSGPTVDAGNPGAPSTLEQGGSTRHRVTRSLQLPLNPPPVRGVFRCAPGGGLWGGAGAAGSAGVLPGGVGDGRGQGGAAGRCWRCSRSPPLGGAPGAAPVRPDSARAS